MQLLKTQHWITNWAFQIARWSTNKLKRLISPSFQKKVARFYASSEKQLADVKVLSIDDKPWLSLIIPVYNTPVVYLDELLASFDAQHVDAVELIFSDDGSTDPQTLEYLSRLKNRSEIKVLLNPENKGISSALNKALEECEGKWVGFLDHDDLIAPGGLKAIYKALTQTDDLQFLYTDELIVDDELKPIDLYLKPAFDPVLLSGMNYINHMSVFKHSGLKEIGFLRSGFDGSQDYDLLLRYLEGLNPAQIVHLPYPAYWWRQIPDSYSRRHLEKALDNAKRTLKQHYVTQSHSVSVGPAVSPEYHKLNYIPDKEIWPSIGIIIPNRNSLRLIRQIMSDVFSKTDYPNLQVVVVDNGSTDQEVLDLYSAYEKSHPNFKALVETEKFNFSRSVNKGFRSLNCDHFLILNNDVEVIADNWLKEMVSCLAFDGVGIVGAKLLYADNTIQHAGVLIG
ncbi:MAG: glycosyltransferase, partial [Chloroflexota bacterium]